MQLVSQQPRGPAEKAATIASDARLSQALLTDLRVGLGSFIPDRAECYLLAHQVIDAMKDPTSNIARARELVAPYRERFWETFRARSAGLINNVTPAFQEIASRAEHGSTIECFDWGTGKGVFPRALQKAIPQLSMSGGDVLDYRSVKDFPFHTITNNRAPEVPTGSQAGALICYVLHHEEKPQEIIREVSRILAPGGSAVIVELCTRTDGAVSEELDRQRVLFSDLLYCVVWQDVDIPMPGTYKTPTTWRALFEDAGFALDQDTRIQGTPLIYATGTLWCSASRGRTLQR